MTTPRTPERAALAQAIAGVEAASAALSAARKATADARSLLAVLTGELERHAAVDRDIANDRADEIVAAIRAGAAPTFAAAPTLPEAAAAVADARNRKHAAEVAVATLASEEREAARAVDAAKAALGNATKAVLIAEAELLAERIEALEAELAPLRAMVGGDLNFVARLPAPLSPRLVRTIRSVDYQVNSREWRLLQEAQPRWIAFADALSRDAHARLEV